jgi:hypothetical protein
MDEYGLSETSDEDKLEQRPERYEDAEKGVQDDGSFFYKSSQQASDSRQEQPAENNKRYSDFVTVKLAQEFSDGDKLNRNRGYACSYNGPNDQTLHVIMNLPIQDMCCFAEGQLQPDSRFYSSKAWT